MAKDDYFRLVYLILKYLYAELKNGNINVTIAEVLQNTDIPDIPKTYLEEIIANLYDDGYIGGKITRKQSIASSVPKLVVINMKILPKGIEYLEENSMMRKVAKIVGDVFDAVR